MQQYGSHINRTTMQSFCNGYQNLKDCDTGCRDYSDGRRFAETGRFQRRRSEERKETEVIVDRSTYFKYDPNYVYGGNRGEDNEHGSERDIGQQSFRHAD